MKSLYLWHAPFVLLFLLFTVVFVWANWGGPKQS
jgi:hypothetical protein